MAGPISMSQGPVKGLASQAGMAPTLDAGLHPDHPDPQEYGPDGVPMQGVKDTGHHHGIELHDQGWFHAESNRHEQETLARIHLDVISRSVDARHAQGICPDGRWTNDPEEFPGAELRLTGTNTSNGLVPFPPHDSQFYVGRKWDPEKSRLRESGMPGHVPDLLGNSTWVRLSDMTDHSDSCHVFDETATHRTHMGRVCQGGLDNGYFVEALQAVSLRPQLVRQLFYCWDVAKCIYIVRLYKHGTWMRVEVDDYVPVAAPSDDGSDGSAPICCRSEFFPHVLWPSLVEKAYAKMFTTRGVMPDRSEEDRGGWEAVGGGGHVEEAMADLTGGVAGRFHTCDVTMERLFIYLYELQRDTLFVARPHRANCELHGVRLNLYYPYCVNRAAVFEGKPYIQMFSGAPSVYDGGLQDISVPYGLIHAKEYPETSSEGFFWIAALDFHEYFDTIFECRLVNSGDVSITGMPPSRLPPQLPAQFHGYDRPGMMPPGMPPLFGAQQFGMSTQGMGPPGSLAGAGTQHIAFDGTPLPWYEWVHANPGEVGVHNEPEFNVTVPDHAVPCEVVCSVEQLDPRMLMTTAERIMPAPILVKVYEKVDGRDFYSKDLVCKSNWHAVRDSMVAFTVHSGGSFKLVAELETHTVVPRMIFRCYTSQPNVHVTAGTASFRHSVVMPTSAPKATKCTLVGCEISSRVVNKDAPVPIDQEHDSLRRPEWDVDPGWQELADEVKKDCSIM